MQQSIRVLHASLSKQSGVGGEGSRGRCLTAPNAREWYIPPTLVASQKQPKDGNARRKVYVTIDGEYKQTYRYSALSRRTITVFLGTIT